MHKKIEKSILSIICNLTLTGFMVSSAHAVSVTPNTVSFTQGDSISETSGNSFTVDLVGSNFTLGPDGAAFALAWDPLVLSYVGTSVANPPWDTSTVNDANSSQGKVDFVFLGKSVGNAGTDFQLASFTFDVVGNAGSASTISISNDPFNVGFVSAGGVPIAANYINSQFQTLNAVPVPAAVWLFGSAILGLSGIKRNRLNLQVANT